MIFRRYFLVKMWYWDAIEPSMAAFWKVKRDDEVPGTPLPTNTPAYSKLIAARYTCTEDVIGADELELRDKANLTHEEAAAVIRLYPDPGV